MPDPTDLERLDAEVAPLRARLDDLTREHNRVLDEIDEQTLAALDLSDVRARTGDALEAAASPRCPRGGARGPRRRVRLDRQDLPRR